jgi:hypothetical protein
MDDSFAGSAVCFGALRRFFKEDEVTMIDRSVAWLNRVEEWTADISDRIFAPYRDRRLSLCTARPEQTGLEDGADGPIEIGQSIFYQGMQASP